MVNSRLSAGQSQWGAGVQKPGRQGLSCQQRGFAQRDKSRPKPVYCPASLKASRVPDASASRSKN